VKIVKLTIISSIVSLNLAAVDLATVMSNVAQTNPKIIQKKKEYNSAYEMLKISEGDYFLPTVDLEAQITKNDTNRQKPLPESESEYTSRYFSITATENLFNGFGTVNDIDAKKAALASSAFAYLQTVNEESLNVSKVYLDLIRNRELLDVEVDNFNKHKKILSAIQARSKAGVGVIGDLQEITAKTNLAYANYLAQSKNLKASQISMNKILGSPLDINLLASPQVGDNLNYTLPQAIDFAISHNPSLFVQKYNVIVARYNQKRDEKDFMPNINLEVSKTYSDGEDDLTDAEYENDNLKGGITLKWNIFNGFKDLHTRKRNISLIHVEQEKYNAMKRDLTEEIELAWTTYKMQEREYAYLTNYVQNAKAKLQTNTKLFQIGKKSLFEFLSSQTDYNSAKEKLINTKYDLIFAKLRVLKALGILIDMANPNIKKEVGIVGNGLFDYQAMNYQADTLPVREEQINQSGSVVLDDVVSFDSYKVVGSKKQAVSSAVKQVVTTTDEVYDSGAVKINNKEYFDEEYVAPRKSVKTYKK